VKAAELNRILEQRRALAEQHVEALEATYLRLINRAGRIAARALKQSTRRGTLAAASWQPPPEGVLFDPSENASGVTDDLRKIHSRVFWSIAGAPLAKAGIRWDVRNPFARHFISGLGKRTGVLLGQGVQPVIASTVADAYERGLSVPDTAALISEQVAARGPAQAAMLARTDLNGLANGASVMAATLVGVAYKEWLTAEDDRVRETHQEADGQVVPVDQPFIVGGEALDYPGDPGGSDEEVCNCRCTVIYTDEAPVTGEAASANPNRGVASLAMAASEQMARRMPGKGFAIAQSPDGMAWEAVLAVEGEPTEDGRMLAPGSITWRTLPLTLMAQTETAPGHDGAEVAGRIDRIWRDGANIMGAGVFDAGEFGTEIARMVADETLRGVSVDLAVNAAEMMMPGMDGNMEPLPEGEMMPDGCVMVVTDGVIGAATVCAFPAIADAAISTAGLDERLTAAIGTLTAVTEMRAKLGQAESRAAELEQAVKDAREERQQTVAQKEETLAMIESLTARIAAGEQVNEAMVAAMSQLTTKQPRTITVTRDKNGRAVAYDQAEKSRSIRVIRDENGRATAYEEVPL